MTLFYDFIRYGPLFRRWLTGQCQSPCTRVPASASSTLDYSRQELTGQSQPTNKGLMNRRADSRDACTTIPFRSDGRSFGRSVCSRRRGKGARSAPARGSPFVAPAEIGGAVPRWYAARTKYLLHVSYSWYGQLHCTRKGLRASLRSAAVTFRAYKKAQKQCVFCSQTKTLLKGVRLS